MGKRKQWLHPQKAVNLLANISNKPTLMQVFMSALAFSLCYFFSSLHLIIPAFDITYYEDSSFFLWNIGLTLCLITQNILMYYSQFYKGKTIMFLVTNAFNIYLFIDVLPIWEDRTYFEYIYALTMFVFSLVLVIKKRDKLLEQNPEDPIVKYIEYSIYIANLKMENKKISKEEYKKRYQEIINDYNQLKEIIKE